MLPNKLKSAGSEMDSSSGERRDCGDDVAMRFINQNGGEKRSEHIECAHTAGTTLFWSSSTANEECFF